MFRRLVLGSIFATIATGLLIGLHYYMVVRLFLDPDLAPDMERAGVLAITVLGLSLVLLPIGERLVPPPWSRLFTIPPSVWMGAAFLLVSVLAFSDLLLIPVTLTPEQSGLRAMVVGALALVLTLVGLKNGLGFPPLKRVDVPVVGWPKALDGYRIAQLSDLHVGPIRGAGYVDALTVAVNALKPDLIAITGDLVDGSIRHVGPMVGGLAELRATDGVFFVTGNHDMYSGPEPWMARVRELGMTVLGNEHVTVRDGFVLAGVHDHQGKLLAPHLASDVARALSNRPPGLPVVLLAHDPSTFKRASEQDVALQISGHTHDGQIWPFRYLVRLVVPWVAGLYRVGESTLYVSRGTGFWGPPLRLGAPAEITELTLRSASNS